MNARDRINKFKRFALTNSVGLYNEDSMTAQQLNIECNKKIVECMEEIERMWVDIEDIKTTLLMNYEGDSEELELTLDIALTNVKNQVDSSYRCLIDEDSMTALEQSGNQAKAVNECLKAVNMMREIVTDVKGAVGMKYDPETEELTITGGVE